MEHTRYKKPTAFILRLTTRKSIKLTRCAFGRFSFVLSLSKHGRKPAYTSTSSVRTGFLHQNVQITSKLEGLIPKGFQKIESFISNAQRVKLILTTFVLFNLGLTGCIFKEKITRPTYQNIQEYKFTYYTGTQAYTGPLELKTINVTNKQLVATLVKEINSLQTGYWHKVYGKESSNTVTLILSDGSKEYSFTIEQNYIIERGKNYSHLGRKGFARHFDMKNTPLLQKIWCEHYENNGESLRHVKPDICSAKQ